LRIERDGVVVRKPAVDVSQGAGQDRLLVFDERQVLSSTAYWSTLITLRAFEAK
jgi:hypothetical protein